MKHRLDVELDFITDLSPLELASRVTPLVREAVERVRQSLGAELEFDIFLSNLDETCCLESDAGVD